MNQQKLASIIRNIADFPKKGIQFKDITPILTTPTAYRYVIDQFCEFATMHKITAIMAPEARGFIFAAAIAYQLKIKLVIARKPNKLPYITYRATYQLEYGENALEIHQDSFLETDRVMIIDDLIATAGTVNACIELVNKTKATVVCIVCVIALTQLHKQPFKNQKQEVIPLLALLEM